MVIICDGGKRHDVAYGSYKLFDDEFNLVLHNQLIFGDNTSNSAEYLILYFAVKKAQDFGFKNVDILTDSSLVVNQLLGNWNCNYPHLKLLRDKIIEICESFSTWNIRKVSRNIIVSHLGH
jgi:ribonuclease HI